MSDTYVVVASQLNRVVKDENGDDEQSFLKRGDTFTAEDVTPKELKRWLSLKPTVIKTEAELEAAAQSAQDAQAALADANAQIAELQAQLAAANAAGAGHAPSANSGGPLAEPAGNASADEWRAYATQQDPDNAAEIAEMSRDDLRDTYKSA